MQKINNTIQEHTTQKLWQGLWLQPTQGWITSEFGARRVFNNSLAYDIHSGLDICNKEGTRILAANSGIVMLAETLPIHGITVIVDHGQGIFAFTST